MADPVTVTIATAVATGAAKKLGESVSEGTAAAFKSLCKSVFARFRSTPEALEALDNARLESDDPDAVAAVAEHLEQAEREDPQIRELMEALRREVAPEDGGGAVHNTIHGDVSGNARIMQAGDIRGDIRL